MPEPPHSVGPMNKASSTPLACVTLLSPPYSDLSYTLPEYLPVGAFSPGQRVAVPLGKNLRVGIIRHISPAPPAKEECSFTLKSIVWPLEKASLLSPAYLDLIQQLAQRQTETSGHILGTILPAGLRSVAVRIRFFHNAKPLEVRIKEFTAMEQEQLSLLGRLWDEGRAEVCRAGLNPLDAEVCCLAQDPPWPVRPAAKAQAAMLEYLFERGEVTRRKLAEDIGKGAAATLSLLASRGLVQIRPADGPPDAIESSPHLAQPAPASGFSLTRQQQEVFDKLMEAVLQGTAATHLLFGITGSGKTAIYLELVKAVLTKGKSVMLLAPEVALAFKLREEARSALSAAVLPEEQRILFHGYQSPALREAAFRRAAKAGDSPFLIVGTRSALLLPLDNVGLIVLDEEHDASFKQDEGLNYQAKELAWYRAKTGNALLLMASATPDLKSFYAAKQGLIPLHTLTERVGGSGLPEVRLIQLPKKSPSPQEGSLLASESLEALASVVEKGEQAVILLNRRGYAPLMYCLSCSTVAKCPHCDISLAYHKGRERLICHYCGYSAPYPSPCAKCKGLQFLPMGEGTEKLEESLAACLPPGTGILRLDRDSTRRPGRMEEILASFARKEASVLVGTQMLSKGHHFPDVTLAVVADADLGLNLPDYRAAERTFQLLLQSSGRSGRGEKPGTVLIQTRDPSHYCWEYVAQADYEGFYERELALRQRRFYPPFVYLALIRISHEAGSEKGQADLGSLGPFLRTQAKSMGLTLLGPAPAPIHVLKGRRRFHCLVKGRDWGALRSLFNAALDATQKSSLRLKLDLDPLSMM